MDIIFFTGIIEAVVFSVIIFSKSRKAHADKLLAFWLLVFAVHLLFPFLNNRLTMEQMIHIGGLDAGLFTLHATMLYLYTKALINDQQHLKRSDLKHLIPFVLVSLSLIPYILLDAQQKTQIVTQKETMPFFIYILMGLNMGFFLFYNILSLLILKKHKKLVRNIFSFTESRDLNWITILVMGTLIMILVLFVFGYLVAVHQISAVEIDKIMYKLLLVYIFVIGYLGFRQGRIYSGVSKSVSENYQHLAKQKGALSKKNNLNHNKELELVKKLTACLEKEKLYLNNELSLYDLADKMNISIYKISHLLNNIMECNFYELVNQYRVEEFKKRMDDQDYENLTLLAIALDCGFNSKATFNRIFKNQTGLTPSEYKQKFLN